MLIVTVFVSCEKKDGYATSPEFEQKEFQLRGDRQALTLTAKNDVNWFLADLTINSEVLRPENWDDISRITFYFSQDNVQNFSTNYLACLYKIEFEDCFVWERPNNKTIKIHLSENKEGKTREIHFQESQVNP